MYRVAVLFAAFAVVTARASIPSVEIEDALDSNLIDLGGDEVSSWPFFRLKNASSPNDIPNEIGRLFTFTHLTAVPSKKEVEGTMRYTLGKRVQNDGMVGYTSDTKTWPNPQDVTLTLKYPTSGQGATVTCVEIIVGQSSKLGEAKVTGGGIGQRSIAIVVTARSTNYLNYVAYFYGM